MQITGIQWVLEDRRQKVSFSSPALCHRRNLVALSLFTWGAGWCRTVSLSPPEALPRRCILHFLLPPPPPNTRPTDGINGKERIDREDVS